jgi:hypothetical protein
VAAIALPPPVVQRVRRTASRATEDIHRSASLRFLQYSVIFCPGEPECDIGGQTARPVHGGQHPVSTSALRNARSRNEFNA